MANRDDCQGRVGVKADSCPFRYVKNHTSPFDDSLPPSGRKDRLDQLKVPEKSTEKNIRLSREIMYKECRYAVDL